MQPQDEVDIVTVAQPANGTSAALAAELMGSQGSSGGATRHKAPAGDAVTVEAAEAAVVLVAALAQQAQKLGVRRCS